MSILLFFVFGCTCNRRQDVEKVKPADSTITDTVQPKSPGRDTDSIILRMTTQVLTALRNKDYKSFADFIHPEAGVRFSPYGYIDTANDIKLSAALFLQKLKNGNKINWGDYDGTGDTILLTVTGYIEKFVYNKDFLHAEKTSLNKMIGSGNSLNNLEAIYKDSDFTESYFSGFEKKYDGMDWCCLRLVFEDYNGVPYLVGVVHDQWTI